MEAILEPLVNSPKLKFYVAELQQLLEIEQTKRTEFYNSIQEGDKVEFINGEIIFHSPVKLRHGNASGRLFKLLSTYVDLHDLGLAGHEKLLISLTRNDYEPDICFFTKAQAEQFLPTQMQFPAPALVVEVLSDSTASNDRGVKFTDYAAHGIPEYWIIDPKAEVVEQYLLAEEQYTLHTKTSDGVITAQTVPGFQITVRAIFEAQENLRMLQQILAGPEG